MLQSDYPLTRCIGYCYTKLNSGQIPDPYHKSMSTKVKTESTEETPKEVALSKKRWRISNNSWLYETLSRPNLIKLGLISVFLAAVDTIQSYYLQRVVNQFSEVNLLPLKFYNAGPVGYALYFPIDFIALFGTLTVLWIWASYILWYHKHVILSKLKFGSS